MNHAIILAAGSSSRMHGEDKLLALVSGKPLLAHTILAFDSWADVDSITIVASQSNKTNIETLVSSLELKKLKGVVLGGAERQESVMRGVSFANPHADDILVIHNGANPLVTSNEISSCIRLAKMHGASACAFALRDTIKKAKDGFIIDSLEREDVWQMQTPQCVRASLYFEGQRNAKEKGIVATDDVSLVLNLGKKVALSSCSPRNFKVTTKDDLALAREILAERRYGLGQDSHRFELQIGKPLMLGGVAIPNHPGFDANSDGDIILHALFNAISSAMGGRSLSITADPLCKAGITDSKAYLEPLLSEMRMQGFHIENMSISLEGKTPKLERHHDAIKKSLCALFGIDAKRIGITFTTGEALTSFGRGEGMQTMCIVLLKK